MKQVSKKEIEDDYVSEDIIIGRTNECIASTRFHNDGTVLHYIKDEDDCLELTDTQLYGFMVMQELQEMEQFDDMEIL